MNSERLPSSRLSRATPVLGRGIVAGLRKSVRWASLAMVSLVFGPAFAANTPMLPDIQRIVDSGKLVVAVSVEPRPPLFYLGENGRLAGFDIELAEDIAAALGVAPQFDREGSGQSGVIARVVAGHADIGISNLARTVRDAAYVPFTRPYLTQSVAVALNRVKATEFGRHCPNLYQVERLALEPNQLGMARNTILEQGLRRHVPGARPVLFDSVDEAWGRVASGELGAALGSEVALKYLLASRAGDNVNVKLCEMRSTNLDTSIVVRPDAPHLLRWLDVYLSQPVFPVDADSVLVGPSPFEWRFRAVREGDN